MTDRPIRVPGPARTIDIAPTPQRVVVTAGGRVIADSDEALTLREAGYAPVQYIPRKHVDLSALSRSSSSTYCPYKGDAAYYSVPAGGRRSIDAAWSYESPFEAVAAITGHLAFYLDRVDAIDLREQD